RDANPGAHAGEHVEQGGARGVQTDAANGQLRTGDQQRGDDEEGGRGQVRGDGQFAAGKVRATSQGNRALRDGELRAKFAQRDFGVVARGHGFGNGGGALGEEAGEQHASL